MIRYFSLSKYIIIFCILIFGSLYSLPNIFGYKPVIQVTYLKNKYNQHVISSYIEKNISKHNLNIIKKIIKKKDIILFFENTEEQLLSKKILDKILKKDFNVTLNLIPDTPEYLKNIKAKPMKLGLDLRGGIYFLIEVDILSNIKNNINNYYYKIRNFFYKKNINYINIKYSDTNIYIHFKKLLHLKNAEYFLIKNYPEFNLTRKIYKKKYYICCKMKDQYVENSNSDIIDKTLYILRNRINELGISETIVRKQGNDKISIQLPGVQDVNKAKEILGKIATLEFLLQNSKYDISKSNTEKIPFDSKILYEKNGKAWLLKKKVILSGKNIVNAKTNYNEYNEPVINVKLGGDISKFKNITKNNIGKRIAIVYKEVKVKNKSKKISKNDFFIKEHIIGIPVIQEALRDQFQITGLNKEDSKNLSILLRAGSLPASLKIIEEKIIGPSMGKENINLGLQSLIIGLVLIIIFMIIIYGILGLFANIALFFNCILITAFMSLLGFTLTLPGIAGIILTLGMSIDANVLVFERIKEEIKNKNSKRMSIIQGYKKAFATVLDANITTLIVGIVLFLFSSGPVKGFAITLSIGILTSIFTAIFCTQAMIYLMYGNNKNSWIFLGFK